ncbi:YwqG family protein [Ectobacillus panaciterrae]|uniref:YwqG family protein n=1 Tax=Ectobacillus panaciterrae TaxID=363872 RepID=UPI0003FBD2BB|nr:YwqG family protein [Ectobacillus panaciterrae]
MTARIEALIERYELTHLKDFIMPTVFPCIKVIPQQADIMPPGRSKMGGVPDFPRDWEYPVYKDKPLHFLAQIDLSDLPQEGFSYKLPQTGLMYFFYLDDAEEGVWGEPEQKDGWRVLYYGGALDELEPRAEADRTYAQCSISFEITHKIPELFIEDEADSDRFLQMLEELMPDRYDNHQMFGVPFSVQGEVFEEMEYYTKTNAQEFTLLFQIDSDWEHLKMQWGDMGMLYFCMSHEALENERFEDAWCIMQCL